MSLTLKESFRLQSLFLCAIKSRFLSMPKGLKPFVLRIYLVQLIFLCPISTDFLHERSNSFEYTTQVIH